MTLRLLPILAAVFALGAAAPVRACSCTQPPPLAEQLKARDYIFTGIVRDIGPDPDTEGHILATIQVTAYWTGEPERTLLVSTPSSSAMCGVNFEVDRKYLVFADSEGYPHPTTHMCLGSNLVEVTQDVIEELGQAIVPVHPQTWGGLKVLMYGPRD